MKKIKGVVYCVTNIRNGKKYVGITTKTTKERWRAHIYNAIERNSDNPLQRAIRKHGPDAFTVHVLARSDDWGQLCQLEQHYIAKLKTHVRHGGYNCTAGGDGTVDLSEESRARISAATRRLNADPEFAARRDARTRRMWANEEFRAKQAAVASKTARRMWADDAYRAKMSEMAKRLNADPEFAARRDAAMSKTAKRLWTDEKFRAKRSEVSRKVAKRLNADPEFRAKNIERLKRLWADEEFRAKMSEMMRTPFNDFCREHGLKPKNVRNRLRRRGIYGLKDINDPRVREVLDEMIAGLH